MGNFSFLGSKRERASERGTLISLLVFRKKGFRV